MAITISDARMISHAPRVECLEVTITPQRLEFFQSYAGIGRDAIPPLPAINLLAITPEIFFSLYTGARGEIVAHQGQGIRNGRGADAVRPVTAEHDAIFTQGGHQPVQPLLWRGDGVEIGVLVPDL